MAQAWRLDNSDGEAYLKFLFDPEQLGENPHPDCGACVYPRRGIRTSEIVDKCLLELDPFPNEEFYATYPKD